MANHKKPLEKKPQNRLDLQKPQLAFDPSGSLLSLAAKLRAAEVKVLKKMNSYPAKWEEGSKFSSTIGPDGFHFSATINRKRKSEETEDQDLKMKKFHTAAEVEIRSIERSAATNDKIPLNSGEINHGVTRNCVGLHESGGTVKSSAENVKQIAKILEDIKNWTSASENAGNETYKRLRTTPLELSFWSLLSCTKNLAGEEALRSIDHKNQSCASYRSKASYPSWRMSRRDLRSVEQLAVEHVIRSKSSELKSRITLLLRKMNRQMVVGEISTPGKFLKVQPSSLTWNGQAQRKFRCEHCAYQTDNRSHLVRHQSSIHNMFKPYHCYICTKEFTRVEYIKQHLLSAHPGVKYDATRAKNDPVVQAEQTTPKHVNHHGDRNTTANGTFRCDFDSTIVSGADCKKLQAVHVNNRTDLLCSYCDFATQDLGCLQQHLDKCLPSPGHFRCRLCREMFTSRSSLQVHSARSHFTILYCCPSCPFYTVSLHTYDWHVAQQHSSQIDRNSCPFCRQPFLTQNELVLHIEFVHLKHIGIGCEDKPSERGRSRGNGQRLPYIRNGVQTILGNDNCWKNGVGRNKV